MEYKIIKQRFHNYSGEDFISSVQTQFGLSELSATYLIRKGLSTLGQIEEFLYPKEQDLFDPFLFSDMKKACGRIQDAICNNEKIIIYGDYDCDGVCASVILYKTLSNLNAQVSCYLPDRFTEGYGFSEEGINNIKDTGATLIISVDNGITASKEINLAKKYGIDVIITDHHICPDNLPDAYAIIDPKNKLDRYPYEHLCGASVAYKMAVALMGESVTLKEELLAFAALATIADLVPLTLENRTIASIGIAQIKKGVNLGLKKLIDVAAINKESITGGNIAYHIAPRINACGRLYKADIALKLFLTEDEEEASLLAKKLNSINEERKQIENNITQEAESFIERYNLLEEKNILIIKLENVNEGVIGVACGKISEKYNRPAIICVEKDGIIKGSARSVSGFDIYNAMVAANDVYIKFGGHSQAAGFTIDASNFEKMSLAIKNAAKESGIERFMVKRTYYDIEAVSSFLTEKSVRELSLFAPYGIQNPSPVFRLSGVYIRNISVMGSAQQHLRFNIIHKFSNFNAVAFFMADAYANALHEDKKYDVLFSAEIDTYKSTGGIKLIVKQITPHYECDQAYYASLYESFIYSNSGVKKSFVPIYASNINVETAIDNFSESVYILNGKDTYLRCISYAHYKNLNTVFSYATDISPFESEAVNIIVNPTEDISNYFTGKKIFVLDPPCFCGFSDDIYNKDMFYLRNYRYVADIVINRDYIAFVYKRLRALDAFGGKIDKFIDYLNTESEKEINYFTFRLCLDIMSEMQIIEYKVSDNVLSLSFCKITDHKDVKYTPTMLKLNCTTVSTEG